MRRVPILALILVIATGIACAESDQDIQAAVQRSLRAYALNDVHTAVRNGSVTLTGSVTICRDRLLADELAGRVQGVNAIDDQINVSGPSIPDNQLKADVERIITQGHHKLGWFGYGSVTTQVQDGIVGLYGTAAAELAAPVIAAVAVTPGVRNVVDRIQRVPPYDSSWSRSHPPDIIH